MALNFNLFNRKDDDEENAFGNIISNVKNTTSNLANRFKQSFQNFNNRQNVSDSQQRARNVRFATNVYDRLKSRVNQQAPGSQFVQNYLSAADRANPYKVPVKQPNNFGKALRSIYQGAKDFTTGIQVSDTKPLAGPNPLNIPGNIRRNIIRMTPDGRIESRFADAMVKGPAQSIYGMAPFVFNQASKLTDKIVSPTTGKTLTQAIQETYAPQTQDEQLQQDVNKFFGRAARDAAIWKATGGIGSSNLVGQAFNLNFKYGGVTLPAVIQTVKNPVIQKALLNMAGTSGLSALALQTLDEEYKGKDIKQNAAEIALNAATYFILGTALEAGGAAFTRSELGNAIPFIRQFKTTINTQAEKQMAGEISNLMSQKGIIQNTSTANNPAYFKYVQDVGEAWADFQQKGDLLGLRDYLRSLPDAPVPIIDMLAGGLDEAAVVAAPGLLRNPVQNFTMVSPELPAGNPQNVLQPGPIIPPQPGTTTAIQPHVINQGPGEVTRFAGDIATPQPNSFVASAPQQIRSLTELANKVDSFETFLRAARSRFDADSLAGYKLSDGSTIVGKNRFTNPVGGIEVENDKTLVQLAQPLDSGESVLVLDNEEVLREIFNDTKNNKALLDETGSEIVEQLPEGAIDLTENPQQVRDVIKKEFEQAIENTGNEIVDRGELGATAPVAQVGDQEIPAGARGVFSDAELDYLTGGSKTIDKDGVLPRSDEYQSVVDVYQASGEVLEYPKKYVDGFNRFVNRFIDGETYRAALISLGETGISLKPSEVRRAFADNFSSYLRGDYVPTEAEFELYDKVIDSLNSMMRRENTVNALLQTDPNVKAAAQQKAIREGQEILNDLDEGFSEFRKLKEQRGKSMRDVKKAFIAAWIDRFYPAKEYDELFFIKLRNLAGGGSARVDFFLDKYLQSTIEKEVKAGRIKDLSQLLALERMDELVNIRGLDRRYTKEEINAGLNALREKLGPEQFAELQQSAQEVREFSNKVLAVVRDSGLISQEDYESILANNQRYVTFDTVAQLAHEVNAEQGSAKQGSSFNSFNVARQDIIKNIGDSTSAIADPLEATIEKIAQSIELADKNSILKDFVDRNINNKDIIVPLRQAENVKARINLKSELKELGTVKRKINRLISTRAKKARMLEREIDQLNQEGLDLSLKKEPKVAEPITFYRKTKSTFDSGKPAYTKVSIPPRVKTVIETLIELPQSDVQRIIKKINTRTGKYRDLLAEIADLNIEYHNTVDDIIQKRIELGELSDITSVPEGYGKINLLRDGIKEEYAVPMDIANAVKGLDAIQLHGFFKALTYPAKIQRAGVIEYNLAFPLRNVPRDVQDAIVGVATQLGFKSLGEFVGQYGDAIAEVLNMGEVWDEWRKYGGAMSTLSQAEVKAGKTDVAISKIAKGGKPELKWNKPIKSYAELMDFLNRLSEEQTRVAAFKQQAKDLPKMENDFVPYGDIPEEYVRAAFHSRNITVDFNRAGNLGRLVNQFVFLFNPTTQGIVRNYELAKENPRRFLASMILTVAVPSITAYAWNRQFKDHDDVASWEDAENFNVILGDRTDEERANRAPIYGFRVAVGNIGQPFHEMITSFLRYMEDKDPVRLDGLLTDVLSAYSPITPPIGQERSLQMIGDILPTGASPIFENIVNIDTFTGAPIEKDYIEGFRREDVPPSRRVGYDTSEFLQAVTKTLSDNFGIEISPARLENLIEGYFGTVGTDALNIADAATSGKLPDVRRAPLTKGFLGIYGGGEAELERKKAKKEEEQIARESLGVREPAFSGGLLGNLFGRPDSAEADSTTQVVDTRGLPESREDLGILYKNALNVTKNYNKKKIETQYKSYKSETERQRDLQKIETEYQEAQALLENIQRQRPNDVFEIELENYGTGSNLGVENRGDWAYEQLSKVQTEEEAQRMVNKLWEAGVLTGRANGTAAYIKEVYGLDLTYTGDDAATKKKAGTGSGSGSRSGSSKVKKFSTRYQLPNLSFKDPLPQLDSSVFMPIKFGRQTSIDTLINNIPTLEEFEKEFFGPESNIKIKPVDPMATTLNQIGRV